MTTYQKTSANKFIAAIKPMFATEHGNQNLTEHSLDFYEESECFLSEDNRSGFCISKDNELCNVFSLVRGRGDSIVECATQEYSNLHGNCFRGKLTDLYFSHGAKEVRSEPNWTPGEPDVVFFKF